MGLNCTVGGARGMFEGRFATEVAGLLDQAFGAEGDWLAVLVPGGRIDQADACQRVGPRRQISGAGLGWAHRNWIGDIIP